MLSRSPVALVSAFVLALAPAAWAQTPPPAPALVAPANGAAAAQPIQLRWNAIVDPDGPIGSYSWEVSTSSTFGTVIASGFNNFGGDVPLETSALVSGLANGTYFWRVKGAQDIGGVTGFIDSPFSAPRSFTVTGLGPAPTGVPTILSPGQGARFHPFEFFDITWSEVVGAHHYILEADEDSAFSHPINLSGGPQIIFGTKFGAGWGNEIPNIFYRIRAVSADNVWGRPSATLTVHVTNTAPLPPAPTQVFPINGASVTTPIHFDWTDAPNPQIQGYDLDIDDEPNFLGAIGVLLVQGISRSDYMVVEDPLVDRINHFPPGTYFWRVRAVAGNAFGPWSAGQRFVVTARPQTPPGLELFWILTDPGSVQGGNSTAARVALNGPAPAGGALVHIASDFPGIELPSQTVLIPAGATDALVAPITTPPVPGASIGTLTAAYGPTWVENSIGCFPILWNGALSADTVVGGVSVTGTVTLLGPAPAGGLEVTLTSDHPALAHGPASVLVPAGATGAAFSVTTSAVSVPTRVVLGFGSALEGYKAPGTWLVLVPPASPAPPPALSTITLSPSTMLGGSSGTGTVTLTAPAPTGGALIRLSGSMEGGVFVPPDVTVPAGSLSATFPITPPPVARPHWAIVQASLGFNGLLHAATVRIDPGATGPAPLFALGVEPNGLIGGSSAHGTVGLAIPAPPGGTVVTLVSSDSAVAQVPPSLLVPAGHSTASFTVTTSSVASFSSASVTASAGGVEKTAFLTVGADPNAPLALLSVTPSVSGAVGGNSINTTIFLNKSAPAGGAVVTLSSSNPAAARVPASVTVQGGLGFATLNITTSPVTVDTPVTITGTLGATHTAQIVVLAPPLSLASLALAPASVVGGVSATGTVGLSTAAPAGGTLVNLASSNTTVAGVPTNVTIAAGATSATFPVTTGVVGSATSVTITATAAGGSRTATLTVNPSAVGFHSPTANAPDAGGDGNGFETGAANAQADDAANAVDTNGGTGSTTACTSPSRDSHRFFNYGLGVPAGAGVLGLEVRLDARADSATGAPKMCVQLSWNGGTSWTVTQSTPTLGTAMTTFVLGGPTDTWGRNWSSAELSDANFRVRVIDVASSTARDFSLDWIAVRVTTGAGAPPDAIAPTVALSAPTAGAVLGGTATITAGASDNVGVARVEFLLDGTLLAADTGAPFSAAWNTTTAANGSHVLAARAFDAAGNQTTSASIGVSVSNVAAPPAALDLTLSGVPTGLRRGQTFTLTGAVANTGGTSASGSSVLVSFTPTDAMRLESPQSSSQSLASVAAGGSQSVAWQVRTDRAASVTLTLTLRNASGATVDTATQTFTIAN